MKPYLLSLGAGLLVGIVYGLLHVRSPAPPVIALVGLLGILIGEQMPPLARNVFHLSHPLRVRLLTPHAADSNAKAPFEKDLAGSRVEATLEGERQRTQRRP